MHPGVGRRRKKGRGGVPVGGIEGQLVLLLFPGTDKLSQYVPALAQHPTGLHEQGEVSDALSKGEELFRQFVAGP
jgi:hypothetical protein